MRKIRISNYIQEFMHDDPVSAQTIINWINSGLLVGSKRGGIWLVHVDEGSQVIQNTTEKDVCMNILSSVQ